MFLNPNYSKDGIVLTSKDKEAFSSRKYLCRDLFTDMKGRPVVLKENLSGSPMPFTVQYGFSTIVFKTYDEAAEFCKNFRRVEE